MAFQPGRPAEAERGTEQSGPIRGTRECGPIPQEGRPDPVCERRALFCRQQGTIRNRKQENSSIKSLSKDVTGDFVEVGQKREKQGTGVRRKGTGVCRTFPSVLPVQPYHRTIQDALTVLGAPSRWEDRAAALRAGWQGWPGSNG